MNDTIIIPLNTKTITLSKGMVAIVDMADYEYLTQWKWSFDGKYAQRKEYIGTFDGKKKFKSIRMHRQIMNATATDEVDHENGEGIYNWRDNLRLTTHQNNMFNMKSHRGSTSKYKGVSWNKRCGKWEVQLTKNGRRVYQAYFNSEEKAAKAYNKAAEIHHMAFARPNPLPD